MIRRSQRCGSPEATLDILLVAIALAAALYGIDALRALPILTG